MKLIAFDVDGTILDTLDTIIHHVNESLHENGFYRIDDKDYVRKALGYGSRFLIEKALIFPYNHIYDKNLTQEILEYYTKRYNSDPTYLTKPYEGILDLLNYIKSKDYILVAYSNKPDVVLQPLIKELFDENLFDLILGYKEGYKSKPDPTVLNEILDRMNISKEEAVYIGDSEVDMETGYNAKVKTIAVTWGFRDRDFLEKTTADYIVDNTEELKKLIDSL